MHNSASIPRPLRASLWDVAFYSLMVGLGETYLSAYVLSLGFSERASGLLITLPTLIGSIIQLFGGYCAQLFGSQKRWVLISASIQGTALILLSLAPGHRGVFFLITAYWAFGLAAGPSWNSWIGSIVPDETRTYFFAHRARVAQFFTVLGLVAAGLALETQSLSQQKLPIFSLLFLASGLCRYASVYFLGRHPESLVRPTVEPRALFRRKFWEWVGARRTLIIIAFLFLTQMATNVSGPFFNAFMLKQLALDYHDYMILISTAFVARVVAGGFLQKLAQRLGPTTLTHLGSLLVVPTPLLWMITHDFGWLILFQIITGVAWGCHELGVTLLLMDKQSHRERVSLLTITQLLNSSAMFLGSWIGYGILGPGSPTQASYHTLFIVSASLRLLPVLVLPLLGGSRLRAIILFFSLFLIIPNLRADILSLDALRAQQLERFDDPRAFRLQLEAALQKVSREREPELWTALHAYAAEAAWFEEEIQTSKAHVESALPVAQAQGFKSLEALLTYVKGGNLEYDAQSEAAEKFFVAATRLATATGDDALIASICNVAGSFFHRAGKRTEAAEYFGLAFQRFPKLPQDAAYYDMLSAVGTLYVQSVGPRREVGMKMILESLQYAKEHHLRYETYWIHQSLIALHRDQDEPDKVEALLNENVAIAQSLGYENYLASGSMERGMLRLQNGKFPEAANDLEFARDFYLKRGVSFYDIPILANLGMAYVRMKKFDRIPKLLRDFEGAVKEGSSPFQKQQVKSMLRFYYEATGQSDKERLVLRDLVDLTILSAQAKRAEEIGRLTRDMEVQRQQFLNERLTDENKVQNEEIHRRERMQRLMLGMLALGGLALAASGVALRRGREIQKQRANLKIILDTIEEGILRFGSDFRIQGEYSLYTSAILGQEESLQDRSIWDLLLAQAQSGAADQEVWRESLSAVFGESRLAWDLNEGNLPREIRVGSRILTLAWQPLPDAEGLTQTVLLLIRDITQQVAMQNETRVAQERVSQMSYRIEAIARGRPLRIAAFLLEAETVLMPLQTMSGFAENEPDIKRRLHTLKGAARSLGLKDISETIHRLEENRADAAWQDLHNGLNAYRELLPHLNMAQDQAVENLWDIAAKLLPEARQRLISCFSQPVAFHVLDQFSAWEQVDAKLIHDMLLHALTNSIDHGFLLPHAQGRRMNEAPCVTLEACEVHQHLEITLRDNGFGIDWQKLNAMAVERNFQPRPNRELTDLLFLDGTSTAGPISSTSGRGIGLSAILAIATKSGGDVSLHDNDRGRGARLRILIPHNTAIANPAA